MKAPFRPQSLIVLLLFLAMACHNQSPDEQQIQHGIVLQSKEVFRDTLLSLQLPAYSERFWVEGGLWFPSSIARGSAFYLFGSDAAHLWLAGYSFSNHRLLVGRLANGEAAAKTDSPISDTLASKPVTLIPPYNKLFFKLIFNLRGNSSQIEVNGVPLTFPLPIELEQVKVFGFGVHHSDVLFEQLRIKGQ